MIFDRSEIRGTSSWPPTSRGFRAALYVLAVLAVLVAAAAGVMSTPWFRRALERQVASRLEDLTGGRVAIGTLHFNPLILQITLEGLVVRGSEASSGAPLLAAKKVVARLSLVPLARRKLRLRTLDCENAVIHLITNPDGSTNFPWPTASQAVDEFLELSIRNLTLARTQIQWNDQRLPLDLDAKYVAFLLHDQGGRRYAGSLSSSATRIQAGHWSAPPLTLTTHFELSPGALNVKSLNWQSSGFTGHGSLSLRNPASPEGSFSFKAMAEIAGFARTLGYKNVQGGTLGLEGRGNYQQGNVTAQGRIEARKLVLRSSVFNPGPVDLSADYLADLRHAEFTNLRATAPIGGAEGRADISFRGSSPEIVLRAQIRGLDMAAALGSFTRGQSVLSRIPRVARIDGTAEAAWTGRLESLRSKFDVQFHSPPGQAPGSFPVSGYARGQAAMAGGFLLDLREAKLQTPQSVLWAQGKLGGLESNLTFELTTSDFQEWRSLAEYLYGVAQPIPLSLESPATLSGAIAGTWAHPEVHGRLEIGSFQYRGWRWDSLAASAVVATDFIQISSGRLRGGKRALTLNASATLEDWILTPRSRVHLSAQAQKAPLEGVNAALGSTYDFQGLATGRLDLDGTTASLAGSGVLRVEQGSFAQEPFDWLSTSIRVAASIWSFEGIQLAKGHGRLGGRLQFDPTQHSFLAEFHGRGFSLAEFRHLSLPRPHSLQPPWLDGQTDFDLQGSGTRDDVQLHSRWSVRGIRVVGDAIGDLQGQVEWQGNQIRFEGGSEGPGGLIHFRGKAQAENNWPLNLKGEYENLRAEPWIRLLLNRKVNAVVVAGGSFSVTGPLKEPARVEAETQTQDLEIKFPDLTWKNEHPIDLRFAQGALTASRFHLRGPSTDLEVEGSIRFGEPGTLSLNAQGQAEAALLGLIDPAIQATGRSELKARVSATLSSEHPAQPLVTGTVDVHDVSLRYAGFPFRVSGLNGEIRLEGERATANSLRGVSGGGSVSLSGFVTLSETPRFDLRADVEQVRIPYPSDFTSVLSGDLRLVGTSERGQLGGEFTVRQVFVGENFNLVARLLEGTGPIEKRLPGIASPLASRIRLSIQLKSGPPLRLETADWNLLADLDLSLQGTLASPVEVGTIHCRSGEASFRGNRYKLNRGEIRMSNPFNTQPQLDLEASTRVQRYDLTVDISGPLDRLKVAYRSDPPLPTEDILSLLALGFSQRQAEMSTVAGRPLPTVQAGALLSQALSSQMTGRVQRLFGVSRIKVDPNVGGVGSPSGARVTFEQQVTRDLTLTYATNTATSQYRVIQFEWAVTENTSLIGVRDQNGIFGVEVKFRKRFH